MWQQPDCGAKPRKRCCQTSGGRLQLGKPHFNRQRAPWRGRGQLGTAAVCQDLALTLLVQIDALMP
jgi:hypothetical protein